MLSKGGIISTIWIYTIDKSTTKTDFVYFFDDLSWSIYTSTCNNVSFFDVFYYKLAKRF